MSEIKVNSIKGVGASAAAITVNNTDGTCTANITNNLSNRNLIINGAMQVAQRGTSSTSSGHYTVDRFYSSYGGTDEAVTQEQADVASGTTPYTLGFRKSYKFTNGNQTSGAGSGDYVAFVYKAEGQDIANSGWNYLSSSSFITLSFWVKSSVAQNFYGYVLSSDGSTQIFPFETGSLSADTWTKITKTIPGNSNLTFNNDNGVGFQFLFWSYIGTDYTDSGVSLNAWATYASGTRTPVSTTTWYTTNDATFEITGVQLEVGSVATDFEHRSFGQELDLCMRYFQRFVSDNNYQIGMGAYYTANQLKCIVPFIKEMRAAPSVIQVTGTDYYVFYRNGAADYFDSFGVENTDERKTCLNNSTQMSGTVGQGGIVRTYNASSRLDLNAEL